jgi:hypothetical protein
MQELESLIQTGGNDMMKQVVQNGGVAFLVPLIFKIGVPIAFLLTTYLHHHFLDDARAEEDEEEAQYGPIMTILFSFAIWNKYSVKVLLFMSILCLGIGWVATGAVHHRLDVTGGPPWSMWWKFAFSFMIVTFIVSILKHGLRSSAYTYFVDELHDNPGKMKNTCIQFGCGYAPHGKQTCDRGKEL